MKIAVTGMRGSLGRVIFEHLNAEKHDLVGLSRGAPPTWGHWKEETYDSIAITSAYLKNQDALIHCAGGGLAGDKRAIFQANLHTTKHLVSALNQTERPLTFILISSIAAGGPSDLLGRARSPRDAPEPKSYYGQSKLAAEESLAELHPRHTAITLRLPTCHGGYEYRWGELFKYLPLGWMVLPPAMQMSHIHVRDVAETISRLLETPQGHASTWNLCAPDSFCWTDLPAMVERLLRRTIRSVSMPKLLVSKPLVSLLDTIEKSGVPPLRYADKLRDAQFHDWRVDGSELYRSLNYTPHRGLAEGLKDMLES